MTSSRAVSGFLLLAGLACGTLRERRVPQPPRVIGGYQVLAADFHVHTFPLSASTLAPWDVVLEARHQGLDVIAITPHNLTLAGKFGRWFSQLIGGPLVLAGEEIHGPDYHLIAAGIHSTISWRLGVADAIDEVHRQGGVAIAAHPTGSKRQAYEGPAARKLDGTEVLQPTTYAREVDAAEMRDFYQRTRVAAIGSSDYHGDGPIGLCRTYVFANERSEHGVLEAIRSRRTVVVDRGRWYGDPELIRLAAEQGGFPEPRWPDTGVLATLSRICGLLGLLGWIFSGVRP